MIKGIQIIAIVVALASAAPSFGQGQDQGQAPRGQGQGRGGQNQNPGQGGGGGRGRGRGGPVVPPRPTPHWPDGRVNFGPIDGETGLWLPVDARLSVPDVGVGRGPGGGPNALRYPNLKYSQVPFQPWARALLDYRLDYAFEPHTRCKPSGGARQFITPYGVEFTDVPNLKRMYIFDVGGPHTWRLIDMAATEQPKDLSSSYYGHSIGHWEGETLVVDTVGFNESFWIDREGMPTTDKLHMIEKFTRIDMNNMRYVVTIDDPGAYTEPWTGGFYMSWTPNSELFEYICQENNFAGALMVGGAESVDRSSKIVP
jgi:hypothetical protein